MKAESHLITTYNVCILQLPIERGGIARISADAFCAVSAHKQTSEAVHGGGFFVAPTTHNH
jgi:hypothetical protein